jgi:hypothetical protein
MASPRLPSKLAKIWRKNRSQFQIAGIVNHAKTRAFAGLPGNGPKIYRTDVGQSISACKGVMLLHSGSFLRRTEKFSLEKKSFRRLEANLKRKKLHEATVDKSKSLSLFSRQTH